MCINLLFFCLFFFQSALLFWRSWKSSSSIEAWTYTFSSETCDTERVSNIISFFSSLYMNLTLSSFSYLILGSSYLEIYLNHYLFFIYDFCIQVQMPVLISMFFSVQKICIPSIKMVCCWTVLALWANDPWSPSWTLPMEYGYNWHTWCYSMSP